MNGFQEHLLEVNEEQYPEFHITLIGSIYDIPELNEMLAGLKKLFEQPFAENIKAQFIGTGTSEEFIQKIRAAVPPKNLIMRSRMSQLEAQKEASRSQLLLVLGFRGMNGIIGTKPFEYMGVRRTLIQMPGDNDIMQQIIEECNAGYCPSTVEEFVEVVKTNYNEWKETGSIRYKGKISQIKRYSREEQVKKLLPFLETLA
ncbi:MAG: hypothetical protein EOO46_19650 [Flavobacterium sp.]|nr:MAG: hypothetical protein EOO46_19650 [Flavobacterium sp.]